jgi:glycosyltransferase involved in cell wall biosynthesis
MTERGRVSAVFTSARFRYEMRRRKTKVEIILSSMTELSGVDAHVDSARHVVVVDDIPTPYRIALFRAIQAIAPFRLSVVWLAARGREKFWELDVARSGLSAYAARDWQVFVPSLDRRFTISRDIVSIVKRLAPDVLITGGYHQTGYWQCLYYAMTRRVPLICWAGGTLVSERSRNPAITAIKSFYLRHCSHILAYGSDAAELFRMRGADPARIHKLYNTSDLMAVRAATAAMRVQDGSPRGPLRLLSVGRIMRDKAIQCLLGPLSRLRDEYPFELRVVGDGPYREELQALVREAGVADRVSFTGYVQQEHLPEHLAWADVFVFPSTYDVWGIVVNEALAGGLYVLSSTLAGATVDLIDQAISGYPFDPRSPTAVEQALRQALGNAEWIRSTRERRAEWVMRFDASEAAKEFVRVCGLALHDGRNDLADQD